MHVFTCCAGVTLIVHKNSCFNHHPQLIFILTSCKQLINIALWEKSASINYQPYLVHTLSALILYFVVFHVNKLYFHFFM